jgi:RimJ/RimL family protein N-acetyltransferase
MFIRSERLFLRPGWPEDWEDLLEIINDDGVVRNLARAPWPYTMEHAMEFAARQQERLLPHFFITLPSSEGARLIGSVGLGRDGDEIELGYWIARDHWGHGYAAEAARAVLRLAEALGHRRIVSHHFADNPASGRVLAKAGFSPTGKQSLRFSAGRGEHMLAVSYAIELGGVGADDDASGEMRAA